MAQPRSVLGTWLVALGALALSGACRSKPDGQPGVMGVDAVPQSNTGGLCAQNGRFSAVSAGGNCPSLEQLSRLAPEPVSVGHNSPAYKGSLSRCAGFDPQEGGFKFRFRVDLVEENSASAGGPGTEVVVETSLHGANLDASPVCGHMIVFSSRTERPSLGPGRVLQVAQRMFLRADRDTPNAHVIADEDGGVLYALIEGERSAQFQADFGDLVPSLRVEPGQKAVCFLSDISQSLTTLNLATLGDKGCQLDSHSQGCCTLWAAQYEIQVLSALLPKPGEDAPRFGFAVRRQGLFAKK